MSSNATIDAGGESRELELRDYLAVVRRRKLTILVTVAVVVIAALGWSYTQKSQYRATTEVLLQARTSEELFQPGDNQPQNATANAARVATEIQVMQSRSVQDAVAHALGKRAAVSIATKGDTDVVGISAEDHDPNEAARIAQTYAETYVSVRRTQAVQDLSDASAQIQEQIDRINQQISDLNTQLSDLNTKIALAQDPAERESLSQERDLLQQKANSQIPALQSRITSYTGQLDNLQLAGNLTQGAQIVSDAQAPTSPVSPKPMRNGMIALFLGLILGVGLAFLRDYLDDSIKSKEDIEALTAGVPVLSIVPAVETWKDRSRTEVISQTHSKAPAAEAYRTLRTSVQFVGLERPLRSLQITSPIAAEGKTTTLANLAVTLARAGKRVVMVDWDLRRPRIESFFGVDNAVGFTNVALGDCSLTDALQRVPDEPGLVVLPSGPTPPNPSELLGTTRAADILNTLCDEADYVLVDCPPLLPVADAIIVAGLVDATVMVVTANSTTKRDAARAIELLEQIDAPVVGTVLNGVRGGGGGAYGYGYGYGDEEPSRGFLARFRSRRDARARASGGAERVDHEVMETSTR